MLFPRDPARSPHARPQRRLCAGLFHGVAAPPPNRWGCTCSWSPAWEGSSPTRSDPSPEMPTC
ncbi:styrene monooxygenase/indole monooxygenase family protein [Pseudonocardia yuanmonensis]|uniref:styrene monooxygenase/indole monooxygenase family protein n=1 Tax=Pseudonocardia yuanmonensis TaxID=1095914 RepID=UPI003CD0A411